MPISIRKTPLVNQLKTDFPDHITYWSRTPTVYNVMGRGFGAAGDGVTDDYEAIWRAIQVANDEGGGTVWFPGGHTYMVSTPFDMQGMSGVVIAGERSSVVLLDPTFNDTSSDGNLFWIRNDAIPTPSSNIRLTGFSINGNRAAGAEANNAIMIVGDSHHIWIDNLYIYNWGSIAGGGDCIYIGDRAENHDIFIHDNVFDNPGRSCVVVTGGVRVHISRNIMYNWNNSAFDIEKNPAVTGPPDPNRVTDIRFTDNIMINELTTSQMIGITCDADPDTNRLGNVLVDGNIGIAGGIPITANTLETLIVTNNIFKTTGAATGNALCFFGSTTARKSVDYFIFNNNIVINDGGTTTNGVWLRSHRYAEICNNVLFNMPGRGIINSGGSGLGLDYDTIIKDNYIVSPSTDGINSDSAKVISGNVVRDTGGFGIIAGRQGCIVSGNYINDTADDGIFCNAIFIQVNDNYVASAGDVGIMLNTTDCEARGNLVISPTTTGINMVAERVAVLNNTVFSAGANGIHCTSARSRIIGNQVQNSTGVGIFANAGRIIIANNRCFDNDIGNQTHGLQLGASIDRLTVHGNEFDENGTAGWTGTTPANYRPNPNGTFATDLAKHNFI